MAAKNKSNEDTTAPKKARKPPKPRTGPSLQATNERKALVVHAIRVLGLTSKVSIAAHLETLPEFEGFRVSPQWVTNVVAAMNKVYESTSEEQRARFPGLQPLPKLSGARGAKDDVLALLAGGAVAIPAPVSAETSTAV